MYLECYLLGMVIGICMRLSAFGVHMTNPWRLDWRLEQGLLYVKTLCLLVRFWYFVDIQQT